MGFLNWSFERMLYKNYKRYSKDCILKQLMSKFYAKIFRFIFSCDIGLGAIIGEGVKIPHPIGIVIGSTAVIEDGVVIMPNVVIGAKYYPPNQHEKRHATVKRNCLLGANSTIIGNVTICENSIIAAGAVVTTDVPANTLVVGNNIMKSKA